VTRRPPSQNGLTLIELLITLIVVSILAAIAIPIFVNQRDKAKSAVLKDNTRYALIAVQTHVASGLNTTWRATDNHAQPATANNAATYVSNAVEVGIENGPHGGNADGYVNPYSRKKAILNLAALTTSATYAPPAIWITNSSTYRYATIPAAGNTNTRSYLKGTIMIVWNGTNVEVFYIDGYGKKSSKMTTVPLN
jgi:type IV pilus assembly protein PilA